MNEPMATSNRPTASTNRFLIGGAGITLTTGANGANGCGAGGCDVCEGDCDSNADCKTGLFCFKRDGFAPVPGCPGDGVGNWDYCVSYS